MLLSNFDEKDGGAVDDALEHSKYHDKDEYRGDTNVERSGVLGLVGPQVAHDRVEDRDVTSLFRLLCSLCDEVGLVKLHASSDCKI